MNFKKTRIIMKRKHLVFAGMWLLTFFGAEGLYHWRKDLESVKLMEALRTAFEYDLPLERYKHEMHMEFLENGARQTVLSHALRGNYPVEFVEFLKEMGVTDPVSSGFSFDFAKKIIKNEHASASSNISVED